ncbi:hypothetical protein ACJZ2D_015111 [Fusarium nematophilum]
MCLLVSRDQQPSYAGMQRLSFDARDNAPGRLADGNCGRVVNIVLQIPVRHICRSLPCRNPRYRQRRRNLSRNVGETTSRIPFPIKAWLISTSGVISGRGGASGMSAPSRRTKAVAPSVQNTSPRNGSTTAAAISRPSPFPILLPSCSCPVGHYL